MTVARADEVIWCYQFAHVLWAIRQTRQIVKELPLSEIMEICGLAESVVLYAREFLFQEGDEAYALYVVKKGVLRVVSRPGRRAATGC